MTRTRRQTLRERVANADRRRLNERVKGRDDVRRLLGTTITPTLERIKLALTSEPPRLHLARNRLDAVLSTIADEHARLDAADRIDRDRISILPEGAEPQD